MESLRTSAFVSTTLATVAVSTCLITFPMLFHYVQRAQSRAQGDTQWCATRSRDMWKDVASLHSSNPAIGSFISAVHENTHRQRRASSAAAFWASQHQQINPAASGWLRDEGLEGLDDLGVQAAAPGCCTCQRGLAGPQGAPGPDGMDGLDGNPGEFGPRGDDVSLSDEYRTKFPEQCPCESPAGVEGPPGLRGNVGSPGNPGSQGDVGAPGEQGESGDLGLAGNNGQPGGAGPLGAAGSLLPGGEGPTGAPGPVGPKGGPGLPGDTGDAGKDGDEGPQGDIGDQGQQGSVGSLGAPGSRGDDGDDGELGSCNECPPARLAPGY